MFIHIYCLFHLESIFVVLQKHDYFRGIVAYLPNEDVTLGNVDRRVKHSGCTLLQTLVISLIV